MYLRDSDWTTQVHVHTRKTVLTGENLFRDPLRTLLQRPSGQIAALDFLRALAIFLVVSDHTAIWWQENFHDSLRLAKFPTFFYGWTGVDLFFILSGFLIGTQIWTEVKWSGSIRFVSFFWRRGMRIWPLYFCYVLAAFLHRGLWPQVGDWLFVSNYIGGVVSGGWSLSTEEQFYVVLPLSALLVASSSIQLRSWFYVLPFLIVIVEITRAFTANCLLNSGYTVADVKEYLYAPAHLHCEALIVGAWIALLGVLKPTALTPAHKRIGLRNTIVMLILNLAFAVFMYKLNSMLFAFLSLSFIYGGVLFSSMRLRSSPVLRHVGIHSTAVFLLARLSYGIYLCHFFIVGYIVKSLGPAARGLIGDCAGFLAVFVVGLCCSAIFSAVTFMVIEQPFLYLRARLSSIHSHTALSEAS